MLKQPGFDFSFSGLKTAVMLEVRAAERQGELDRVRADIAASFQRAAIDTLVARTLRAAREERSRRIVVAGGVGANVLLRAALSQKFDGQIFYPRPEFCTDNGAMIAIAGALRLSDALPAGTIEARARWPLETLRPPAAR
jgi:N6-L-threonylcarbamoyladenine synthase